MNDSLNKFFSTDTNINYENIIHDATTWTFVEYFFEASVTKNIPSSELIHLAECINKDSQNWLNFHSNMSTLSEEYLKSETHKSFLNIIKNYFGEGANNLLKERKNLSIFNLQEIHVLNQTIFDNLGEEFVNNVINYNYSLKGSLTTIRDLLINKNNEMETFKLYYSLYKEVVGSKPEHFDTLFLKYEKYKDIVSELKGKKVTQEQKQILKEVFRDESNKYNLHTLSDLNDFYNQKNKCYFTYKQNALNRYDIESLGLSILNNFFALDNTVDAPVDFIPNSNVLKSLLNHFDIEEIINEKNTHLSNEEKDVLKDLIMIDKLMYISDDYFDPLGLGEDRMQKLKLIAEKYEAKGNKIPDFILSLKDKISSVFVKDMINSISTVSDLEKKYINGEQNIYRVEKSSHVEYTLDGTDFSFIQATNFVNGGIGISGYKLEGNVAESWFTFENGVSHVSCSYINQDNLCSIEFTDACKKRGGDKLTYIFDCPEIVMMGPEDVYSPQDPRQSVISSLLGTKFTYSKKLIENSGKQAGKITDYNEIVIYRYSLNSNVIHFGGKIIPSGILVNEEIKDYHIEAAEQFTKFLIENNLKPEGYKMPIIVVNKKKYIELQNEKRKQQIKQIVSDNNENLSIQTSQEDNKSQTIVSQDEEMQSIKKGR